MFIFSKMGSQSFKMKKNKFPTIHQCGEMAQEGKVLVMKLEFKSPQCTESWP